MKLKDFRTRFTNLLSETYPKTEVDTFFFLLIEEYLNLKRIDVSLQPSFEVSEEKLNLLELALKRLLKEEPLQYIIGNTEFYGLQFYVDKNVLIPRPETEELIEWILAEVGKLERYKVAKSFSILDIGTGSGCIPITLKTHLSNTTISAIDVSEAALKVAAKNAELNNVIVNFIAQDILNSSKLPSNFDIIISNPPYVRELEKVEIMNNVLDNEPHLALFVENENPLIFYNRIADLAKKHLNQNGQLFFEINQYLGQETVDLLQAKGFKNIQLKKDLIGNDRMILAHK